MAKSVTVVGSGNWGSTIAKIVGENLQKPENTLFTSTVKMWVLEEDFENRKLSEIINTDHVNPRYLPGVELPHNVLAVPDLLESVKDADILIFVIPHQFLSATCHKIKPAIKPSAKAVTLIKGFEISKEGGITLISDTIREILDLPCGALMGANLANEVARGNYCEATVACADLEYAQELKCLFQTNYFRIVAIKDEAATELCGALKNVVAMAAGFVEGLGYGENTKAAVIRLGFKEMMKFAYTFFGHRGIEANTFLESCGIADLVTTCYGGRNRKVAMAFTKGGKSIADLEKELLNGQSAQGPLTAREVNVMLQKIGKADEYPLFTAVHLICTNQKAVDKMIECLQNHPEHM